MNNLPLFSILIANYNNGKYLDEAVCSVVAQTYANWEIIIVDDCSTDNSHEVYNKYESDNRIIIAHNDVNRGCGYTKRRCVELAKGEICGFLDPDDTVTHDAIEIMVKEHNNHKEAAIICSRHNFCDDNLHVLCESDFRDKSRLNYLTERFHTVEVFAAFKKSAYNKSPGLNPNFKRAVDQDLYYLLEEQGPVVFIDDLLYNYRVHNDSLSIGHYKAMYWHVLAIEDACKRRGLNSEDIVGAMFGRIIEGQEKKYNAIVNSNYYKLGYSLLYPFARIRRKIMKLVKG
jgi:glycosyltransferase involved in cell wall biosynthesis